MVRSIRDDGTAITIITAEGRTITIEVADLVATMKAEFDKASDRLDAMLEHARSKCPESIRMMLWVDIAPETMTLVEAVICSDVCECPFDVNRWNHKHVEPESEERC